MSQVTYAVTGTDRCGRRFSLLYSNYIQAMGINLWRGSVWRVVHGRRTLIKRVFN